MLVSCGCSNKLPQPWLFKTIKFCSLTARSLTYKGRNQGVSRGCAPLRRSRGESILCLFQLPVPAGIPSLVATLLQSLPLWSHCPLLFCRYQICLYLIFFFDVDHFFKSLLNLLPYCFCFMFLVFWPRGMWDLSSLTRDQTRTPCIGRRSLNHWTAREVPLLNSYENTCDWI